MRGKYKRAKTKMKRCWQRVLCAATMVKIFKKEGESGYGFVVRIIGERQSCLEVGHHQHRTFAMKWAMLRRHITAICIRAEEAGNYLKRLRSLRFLG